jgi:hypothetical protein
MELLGDIIRYIAVASIVINFVALDLFVIFAILDIYKKTKK